MHNYIDAFFIFGAKYLYRLIYLIAFIWWLRQPNSRKIEIFIFACFCFPLILLAGNFAGDLYNNPRPFVVEHFKPLINHRANNGFPSHHALLASAAAAIVFIFNRRVGIVLWAAALIVGVSRVYVGVHHGLDIVASFLISITAAGLVYFLKKYFKNVKINLVRRHS